MPKHIVPTTADRVDHDFRSTRASLRRVRGACELARARSFTCRFRLPSVASCRSKAPWVPTRSRAVDMRPVRQSRVSPKHHSLLQHACAHRLIHRRLPRGIGLFERFRMLARSSDLRCACRRRPQQLRAAFRNVWLEATSMVSGVSEYRSATFWRWQVSPAGRGSVSHGGT